MRKPYISPLQPHRSQYPGPHKPGAVVMAPAITLIALASLGLVGAIFGAVVSATAEPDQISYSAPPLVELIQANRTGPVAASIQAGFAALNVVILFGAIQMLRFKMWGVAFTISILSMLNVGNCYCVLGLPVGIWSIVVLTHPDVKNAFK